MDMDKVIRRKQLLEMIGVSAATQYRMERAGLFPRRFRLGKGLVGWHLTEIEEWLRSREPVSIHCPDATNKGSIVGVVPQVEVLGHRPGRGRKDP
ncbi:AlpA family phage regulatory protein [Geomonas subterranea]|uniref:AlpA family phage regulatory protein n=1 Tax=Geomonas subterranea TaxID=2847989 RepID=A0ABX8LG58_9BACT|nr:AlpA family phage regulatory protein [Geomonas subterranea]QXE91025.1 AlpA family phage regulatory protein [Geomonas subterranea]QXM10890.1 AlpA family phage regulatory protein [Geomonas subterranea]